MDVRLTRAGNRMVGLAMMLVVSTVIGIVVVAAAKSPAGPNAPGAAADPKAPAAVTPSTTPLPAKYVVLTFDDGPGRRVHPEGARNPGRVRGEGDVLRGR